MALPLLNLDDRRWADLVEEARSLIPLHAPAWTDHNIHDPGVTIIDLLAWITESNLYAINRIQPAHLHKFLELVGIEPGPPKPANAIVAFQRADNAASDASPTHLPADTEVEGDAARGLVRFRTLESIDVAPTELRAVLIHESGAFQDATPRWERGESIALFGPDPRQGNALVLGFDAFPTTVAAPDGFSFSLCFEIDVPATDAGARSSEDERHRLLAERTPIGLHHSARVLWEYLHESGGWRPIEGAHARVDDDTRAATLNGRVRFHFETTPRVKRARLGDASTELHWLRCRFAGGAFDASPSATVVANAVRAVQAVRAQSLWQVPIEAIPGGPPPFVPGQEYPLTITFSNRVPERERDGSARLDALSIAEHAGEEQPALRVLSFVAPTMDRPGRLELEAEWLGKASGHPHAKVRLPHQIVLVETFRLYTIEDGVWHEWQRQADMFAAGRGDRVFVLAAGQGSVLFGDGERGRVPPRGADVIAVYETTLGVDGNVEAGLLSRVSDSAHNRATVPDLDISIDAVTVTNLFAAAGGKTVEPLQSAVARAFTLREQRTRAITLADYEALAKGTPGTRIARAVAQPNVHPGFPCYEAVGVITVIVVPWLPRNRPLPSAGLLRVVQSYLDRRRLIGSRVIVTGPTYRQLSVRASVRAHSAADTDTVRTRITSALDSFFDPLYGGAAGDGWPIGRDVYRSEVLQVIDETPGVDHVLSLELVPDGGEPGCGNVCLGPTDLVAVAPHTIEVVR